MKYFALLLPEQVRQITPSAHPDREQLPQPDISGSETRNQVILDLSSKVSEQDLQIMDLERKLRDRDEEIEKLLHGGKNPALSRSGLNSTEQSLRSKPYNTLHQTIPELEPTAGTPAANSTDHDSLDFISPKGPQSKESQSHADDDMAELRMLSQEIVKLQKRRPNKGRGKNGKVQEAHGHTGQEGSSVGYSLTGLLDGLSSTGTETMISDTQSRRSRQVEGSSSGGKSVSTPVRSSSWDSSSPSDEETTTASTRNNARQNNIRKVSAPKKKSKHALDNTSKLLLCEGSQMLGDVANPRELAYPHSSLTSGGDEGYNIQAIDSLDTQISATPNHRGLPVR